MGCWPLCAADAVHMCIKPCPQDEVAAALAATLGGQLLSGATDGRNALSPKGSAATPCGRAANAEEGTEFSSLQHALRHLTTPVRARSRAVIAAKDLPSPAAQSHNGPGSNEGGGSSDAAHPTTGPKSGGNTTRPFGSSLSSAVSALLKSRDAEQAPGSGVGGAGAPGSRSAVGPGSMASVVRTHSTLQQGVDGQPCTEGGTPLSASFHRTSASGASTGALDYWCHSLGSTGAHPIMHQVPRGMLSVHGTTWVRSCDWVCSCCLDALAQNINLHTSTCANRVFQRMWGCALQRAAPSTATPLSAVRWPR